MPGPVRASLTVRRTAAVTPAMTRVTLGGDDLAGFHTLAPDQQVKLFLPRGGRAPVVPPLPADGDLRVWYRAYLEQPDAERARMRSYSVRRHRPGDREIDVDVVTRHDGAHDPGPGACWAAGARPGDPVVVLGPSVSHHRCPGPADWRLLVGDASALPAIGALLDARRPGEPTLVRIEVPGPEDEQALAVDDAVDLRWVHRDPACDGDPLLEAVRATPLLPGRPSAWVAGEASTVRAVRRHLVGQGVDRAQIAFAGYWRRHLTQDDDATTADVAEQAEEVA